jgi:cobalt-zinc-cadmium efflux system outer membrane protein
MSIRKPPLHRLTAFVLCAIVTGCTIYHSKPLASPETEAAMQSPDRAELARRASQLRHPLIPLVTLDFSQPLTPDEITVVTVLANPDLRALRAKENIAAAQMFESGLFPDPQISAGVDQVLSPKGEGLVSAYAGGLTLDLLGALAVRSVERQAARTRVTQTRLDVAWEEWSTAGKARLLAIRLPYQVRAAALAQSASEEADRILATILKAAERGDLKGDEVQTWRITAADARIRATTAARELQTTRLDLNTLLGLLPQEPLDVAEAARLQPWTAPDPDALFQAARKQRLDLLALERGYESQEAALHRAILGQYPRLGITLTRARDTSDVQTFGPSVSLDLPLWNRNRGKIAVASATRAQMQAEFVARLHQTRAEIAALIDGLNRDEAARAALEAGIGDVERIAGAYEQSARRGTVTQPVAAGIRAAAIDKQITLLGLEQSCAEQRLALALATGTRFP